MTRVATGHRSFQNAVPVQNRLLAAKWDKQLYIGHRQRLTEVKPQVDCRMPFTMGLKYGDVTSKKAPTKKEKARADQEEKINAENQRLLGKMNDISSKKGGAKVVVKAGARQPKRFSTHLNFNHMKEMDRVNKENQRLLHKICTNEPMYSNKVFARDYSKSRNFQGAITRYPEVSVVVTRGTKPPAKPLLEKIMTE